MMIPTSAILFFSALLFNPVQCQTQFEFWWSQDDTVSTYYATTDPKSGLVLKPMDPSPHDNDTARVNIGAGLPYHAKVTIPRSPFYIAFAGANNGGQFHDTFIGNPAGVILSNSLMNGNTRVKTDDSWRCKGFDFPDDSSIQWPKKIETKALIEDGLSNEQYLKAASGYDFAISMFNNNQVVYHGYQPNIPLGARWIWAEGGFGPENPPPFKVICIKKFTFGG